MKAKIFAVTTLAVMTLAGCSSTPKDMGKPFVQDKSKSVALNVAAYAGYPTLLRDNSYSNELDTLVVSTSNALLLANDLAGSLGSFGGAALGAGLGLMSGLTAEYPLDHSQVVTAKLNPGEDFRSPQAVARVIKANYQKRIARSGDGETLGGLLAKESLDDYVCEAYSSSNFDYKCYDPAYEDYSHLVKVARPANGTEFGEVMPLPVGQYGVYLMRTDRGGVLMPKADAPDAYFHMKDGAYVIGDTILPKVAPREDGKRLVFLHGKATMI